MPKKGTVVSLAIPAHMRSNLAHSSSTARKGIAAIQNQEAEMEVDDEDVTGEDEGDDDNMMEMLAMLQEFQKRKATKSSARSIAFQKEKETLFAEARQKADHVVREGMASLDRARALISDLKAKEVSQDVTLNKLKVIWSGQDECVESLLGHRTGVIEDLSHRRAAHINEASATLEAQAAAREKSRKRLCGIASDRMATNMENQKVAADATALIKHYKSLLQL